jgi:hypothetical protein
MSTLLAEDNALARKEANNAALVKASRDRSRSPTRPTGTGGGSHGSGGSGNRGGGSGSRGSKDVVM